MIKLALTRPLLRRELERERSVSAEEVIMFLNHAALHLYVKWVWLVDDSWLSVSNVVIAEVSVTDIWSRLIIACYVGCIWDDVLFSEYF